NVTRENSRFDFKDSPFYISRETQAWDVAPDSLRRAAVSSFGFSGTNAHLVIEEYLQPDQHLAPSSENTNFIVPLSARTPEQLQQKAQDLLEFIGVSQCRYPVDQSITSPQSVNLASLAYTLQIGRETMEERLGFVVNSINQLAEKLNAYINGERNIESTYHGRIAP